METLLRQLISKCLTPIALLLAMAFFAQPALAQKTKAQLSTQVSSTFPDNTTGAITPLGIRTFQNDLINSIMPTAPVVSGNLACFNGTTGLLQDCGTAPNILTIGTTAISGGTGAGLLYNNSGVLGNASAASSDCTASGGNVICTKTNGVAFGAFATGTNAANLTGNLAVARFNGGTGANGNTFWAGDGTWKAAGNVNAGQFGITCDGLTDDGPAFKAAFEALQGAPLVLPAGTCRIATTAYYNTTAAAGILTVPGLKVYGQGRGVTKIEADVPNGYAIAANSAWASVHKSMFAPTAGTSGSLATNTYFVQATVTLGGTEIYVGPARSVFVTGPNGSVAITLQPIDAGYCYNLYIGTANPPVNYATVSGTDAVCLAGNQTVTITAAGGAHAIPTTTRAVWQESQIANLSIVNETATSGASGVLWFRTSYSTMSNVYMKGLSGNGLDMPNWTGDNDGNFVVTVDQSKFDAISGWCIMTAGNTLEFSNFTVSNSVFNQCGTQPTDWATSKTISAITNANPGVVTTASAHNLLFGDQVLIQSVAGMSLPAAHYRACGTVSGSTFSLCDLNGDNVNTTSLGAYTASSGNERLTFRPPQMQANGNGPTMSGAIAYTGLISNWINNGFTENKNVNVYFSEAGANDQALFSGNDFENTSGVGMYVANVIGMNWLTGECLSAASIAVNVTCIQFGTGLNKGGAQNVQIRNMKFRNDYGAALGFVQVKGAGGLTYPSTISVNNVYWQTFSGLSKYIGFGGNPFPFFWARFDGKTGSTCTLKDSYNVASCTRNGTGDYTLTFSAQPLSANYAISGSAYNTGTNIGFVAANSLPNLTTTSARFLCVNPSVVAQDCDFVSVQGFGTPN